ncbi:arginyltransferase [Alteromonas lipolytica]|uniref:Aspartate/glutamate leucyltransferase n=1 Tax=Alteromonas lipolytica TaxID=1856405 RepID=A0A1E8FGD3_9ALTE|nr:arginyltransferase [Alteromonas lipolytica]OFI34991.1 arginyltransferase [Alteromonas lipolytica]GGF55697.1 putative arginyl-tRNA--protein transferase [Alteromonas lipolytica]
MKFGVTQPFECSYLPGHEEQLLVYVGENASTALHYPQLIHAGFRRSGGQVYRPYCQHCSACHSIRLPVSDFSPSRSQRRLLNKNKRFSIKTAEQPNPHYYPLYERYINQRHSDGSMYPPTRAQFDSFLACEWNTPLFIEAYDEDKLIAVAVTDLIDGPSGTDGYSAMYTFYDPDYHSASLGTWMILQQIAQTRQQGKTYLFLGYQIDACNKMNYKNRFFPYERYINHRWLRVDSEQQAQKLTTLLQTPTPL